MNLVFSKKKLTALALALSQKIYARAQFLFARPCAHARAQNLLNAAQFCAQFRIFKGW